MDSCRWQPIDVEEQFVSLTQTEQVSAGQELLQMLGVPSKVGRKSKLDAKQLGDVDWNVIVKQTFIEVKMPPCSGDLRRSMSDSALPRYEKADEPWMAFVSGKPQDMSDVSTNFSVEAEDLDANFGGSSRWSSEGEGEPEMMVQQAVPYQYLESWWMPMNYDQSSIGFDPSTASFDPTLGFDQTSLGFDANSFVPMQWADHTTMGSVECHGVDTDADAQEWRTTVMIRNMPNNYTREMLLELVDSMGFAGTYDFAYLPVDFQSQAGLGYAFINFDSVVNAQLCFERFEGFSNWTVPSEKVCTVTWSSPTQGLEQHIERYKNSPVMHQSLPDAWKPVLLQNGMRVPFPPPSKQIKTPKVRQHPSTKSL